MLFLAFCFISFSRSGESLMPRLTQLRADSVDFIRHAIPEFRCQSRKKRESFLIKATVSEEFVGFFSFLSKGLLSLGEMGGFFLSFSSFIYIQSVSSSSGFIWKVRHFSSPGPRFTSSTCCSTPAQLREIRYFSLIFLTGNKQRKRRKKYKESTTSISF